MEYDLDMKGPGFIDSGLQAGKILKKATNVVPVNPCTSSVHSQTCMFGNVPKHTCLGTEKQAVHKKFSQQNEKSLFFRAFLS